ncbi:hypothetical protein LGL55_23080 [Clostridium tagluense]|uniref:hypothetical protein n=1 Tax=Clostridium tagluense TaxID=360422 RepID=UPI001CF1613E|nr:hypothetical protein [Clostridium tagluense]MCB2313671.1 hypothetical protein [Clostridium tagluense]MCB2318773.1 hypothetical protein [Clostridium tagluense]MCB2323623.1 hypothetical protein [Clostridium tagluense]MCB2328526.1 hypothetical protein [Clostridium tagluense]MCB2333017.1 hypothetical protein [Clostridium tagluense]
MNKNKIIFVSLVILMIIYSIYTYPLNIEKNHQGLLVSEINKNLEKTINIKIKGKLYRKPFHNRNIFKGIMEIDNKVYELDLFSDKSKKYMIGGIQIKTNKEISSIEIIENFEGVHISSFKESDIDIFAPAENKKDCTEIYNELLKLVISNNMPD